MGVKPTRRLAFAADNGGVAQGYGAGMCGTSLAFIWQDSQEEPRERNRGIGSFKAVKHLHVAPMYVSDLVWDRFVTV